MLPYVSLSFEASPRVDIKGYATLCYVALCYAFCAMLYYSTIPHSYFFKVQRLSEMNRGLFLISHLVFLYYNEN